ncbi:MAG: hypothetical protein KUF72_02895 [Candidatus Thiodiazotropha sp. (ex Ctena orbiculata)]|nr:hypothetical protein [Candidatus Thiodiazotropha taylori]
MKSFAPIPGSELKAQLLPAIVGVEIGIKVLQYEYKVSQNRAATDHRSIDCRGFRTTPQGDKKSDRRNS